MKQPLHKNHLGTIENENGCYSIIILLLTKNCPPIVYNAVSPNNDGLNDIFFIKGLRNIF